MLRQRRIPVEKTLGFAVSHNLLDHLGKHFYIPINEAHGLFVLFGVLQAAQRRLASPTAGNRCPRPSRSYRLCPERLQFSLLRRSRREWISIGNVGPPWSSRRNRSHTLPLASTRSGLFVTQCSLPPFVSNSFVVSEIWIRLGRPVLSILAAVFTVSPKSYRSGQQQQG